MENPVTPQKKPYKVIVEKGKTYSWCACGLSLKQPFCDGTHKKEGIFKSLKYLAAENKVRQKARPSFEELKNDLKSLSQLIHSAPRQVKTSAVRDTQN